MRKHTMWAVLALTTAAGAAGFALQTESSAIAASQHDEADGGGSAVPETTRGESQTAPGEHRAAPGEDGGAAIPEAVPDEARAEPKGSATTQAESEACPMTPTAKLHMVLRELHAMNHAEIEKGREAEKRAQAGEVKEFARIMVRDHTEADRRLTEYAKNNGVDLTKVAPIDPIHAALDRADAASEKALSTKRGASFDAAYVAPQAFEHRVVLGVVEEGQKYAKDDAKDFLDGMHRMMSDHLVRATKLIDQLQFAPAAVGGGPAEKEKGSSEKSGTEADGGGESLSTDAGE